MDGQVYRGSVARERNVDLEDPVNGVYYGVEFHENGKRKIRVVKKDVFLDKIKTTKSHPEVKPLPQKTGSFARTVIIDEETDIEKDEFKFLHPDSVNPNKDFFEREGAKDGERGTVMGCAFLFILVGIVLAYYYPIVGIPLIIFSVLAIIGTLPQKNDTVQASFITRQSVHHSNN